MTVKISSRVLGKKKRNQQPSQDYFEEKWEKLFLPLIINLKNEDEIKFPLEFYHRLISSLHMMKQNSELNKRVKEEITIYIENMANKVFTVDCNDIGETGFNLINQGK